MNFDPNEVKIFFDPHPGFAGAAIPMPTLIKAVADELNGKRMRLSDAVAKIQAATEGRVSIQDGWISLMIHTEKGASHMFRVIRFF